MSVNHIFMLIFLNIEYPVLNCCDFVNEGHIIMNNAPFRNKYCPEICFLLIIWNKVLIIDFGWLCFHDLWQLFKLRLTKEVNLESALLLLGSKLSLLVGKDVILGHTLPLENNLDLPVKIYFQYVQGQKT